MIVILFLLAGVAIATDPLICSLHGQSHVLMTDGTTRHTLAGSGLADIFSTTGLDVQCDMNQTSSAQSSVSSCRFLITSTTAPCSVDIVHGNQPGHVSVWGQVLPVTALEEFVSANTDPALGLACHAIDDDTITIEITQRDAERFILIESSPNSLTITTSNVTSCSGACGTCQGPQTAPQPETIAVMPFRAIQPQRRCGSMSSSPTAAQLPAVSPYTDLSSTMSPLATFASPEARDAVIAECSGRDHARLIADSLFAGYVEACADDIASGASPAVAKANMDAFVTVIENRQKVELAADALRRNPASVICAACMSVEWDHPINTTSVLEISKLASIASGQHRAKNRAMYKKQAAAAAKPQNLYEKKTSAPHDLGWPASSAPLASLSFPATTSPSSLAAASQQSTSMPSSAPATTSPSSLAAASQQSTSMPSSAPATTMPTSSPSATSMPTSAPSSMDAALPRKALYEHHYKPDSDNDEGVNFPTFTPRPLTTFDMSTPVPTGSDALATSSYPATTSPQYRPDSYTTVPTPIPTGASALPAMQMPSTTPGYPFGTQPQSTFPSNPITSPYGLESTTMPTSSPLMAPYLTPMPTTSAVSAQASTSVPTSTPSTSTPSSYPTGNSTLGQTTTTAPTSSPTGLSSGTPSPIPTPAPTSSYVAAISPSTAPGTPIPSSGNAAGITPSPIPTPAPTSSYVAAISPSTAPGTPIPSSSNAAGIAQTPVPTSNMSSSSTTNGPGTSTPIPTVPSPAPTSNFSTAAPATSVPTSAPMGSGNSTWSPTTPAAIKFASPIPISSVPTTTPGNDTAGISQMTTSPQQQPGTTDPRPVLFTTSPSNVSAGITTTTMPTTSPSTDNGTSPAATTAPTSIPVMLTSSPINNSSSAAPATSVPTSSPAATNQSSAAPTSPAGGVPSTSPVANQSSAAPTSPASSLSTTSPVSNLSSTAPTSSPAVVPSTAPATNQSSAAPTSVLTTAPVANLSSAAPTSPGAFLPSTSPVANLSSTSAPPTNGSSAMGASRVPDQSPSPSTNSTRPPITSSPIEIPLVIPTPAPTSSSIVRPQTPMTFPPVSNVAPAVPTTMPYVMGTVPAMIAPLTGRGSVYGCQCNMSAMALKDSLDKVQYALDSYLIDALAKSVLDGRDHDLLTVIACGLGGPNNADIKALSISEDEATNLCRQCEYSSNKKRSSNVPPTSPTVMGRRTRNVVPTPIMSNRNIGQPSTVKNGLPSVLNNKAGLMNTNPSSPSIMFGNPSTTMANVYPATSTMNGYPTAPGIATMNGYPTAPGISTMNGYPTAPGISTMNGYPTAPGTTSVYPSNLGGHGGIYPERDVSGTNQVPIVTRTHTQAYPIVA